MLMVGAGLLRLLGAERETGAGSAQVGETIGRGAAAGRRSENLDTSGTQAGGRHRRVCVVG